MPVDFRIGGTASLTRTATGRTFLTFLPQEETRKLLDREMRENRGVEEYRHITRKWLRAELITVRQKGLSRSATKWCSPQACHWPATAPSPHPSVIPMRGCASYSRCCTDTPMRTGEAYRDANPAGARDAARAAAMKAPVCTHYRARSSRAIDSKHRRHRPRG